MRPAFPDRLEAALARLERQAPQQRIALGLERVRQVFDRLFGARSRPRVGPSTGPAAGHCIHVAGTNGKGSTVAFLEAIARAAGRSCVACTSPHLVKFSERFRVNGEPARDSEIVAALAAVDHARDDTELTWFEHVTLAGFVLADRHRPDWLISEVGMGGRLDAVNVLDPDVAVITSIGLDHRQWLGSTRAAIAREKCGIARPGKPVVVTEKRCPAGMLGVLDEIGAQTRLAGRDLDWRWRGERLGIRIGGRRFERLELALAGRHQAANAAAAVAAALALEPELPEAVVRTGLATARLQGRFERIPVRVTGLPAVIVDVAHNPAAARALAVQLQAIPGVKVAVFSALADKDIAGIVRPLRKHFRHWYLAGMDGPRGLSAEQLSARVRALLSEDSAEALESVSEALKRARAQVDTDATIVVFGSFLTVADAIRSLHSRQAE
ncbi:MAG: bifunctional folylpolyglutamate synthase/dihydrofolate synthase [Wenzhouxiangellaceae bacterium]